MAIIEKDTSWIAEKKVSKYVVGGNVCTFVMEGSVEDGPQKSEARSIHSIPEKRR